MLCIYLLCLSACSKNDPYSNLKNAEIVCLSVNQNYPQLATPPDYPLFDAMSTTLEALGLQVVAGDDTCDVYVDIELTIFAKSASYSHYASAGYSECFTGSRYEAIVHIDDIEKEFSHNFPTIRGTINHCPPISAAAFSKTAYHAIANILKSLWQDSHPNIIEVGLSHKDWEMRAAMASSLRVQNGPLLFVHLMKEENYDVRRAMSISLGDMYSDFDIDEFDIFLCNHLDWFEDQVFLEWFDDIRPGMSENIQEECNKME